MAAPTWRCNDRLSLVSTRPGCSVPGSEKPGCSHRWGKVAYDNSFMGSFFGSMQIELLDRRDWTTRNDLANAIFD